MKLTTRLLKGLGLFCIIANLQLNAQNDCNTDCSIQCIGQINVSLDQNCQTEITPAMGAIGVEYFCNSFYTVQLYDEHGKLLPGTTVGIEYKDENLTYKITENECGNSCWGTILIEYKYPPLIDCPPDLTLTCGALNLLEIPEATAICADYDIVVYSEDKQTLTCDSEYSSIITRTYHVYDVYGNESFCSHDIYVRRIDFDQLIFPGPAIISCNDTLMRFDANGIPIPWYTVPLSGSGMADGIPILCDPEVDDGLYCPSSDDLSGVPLIPTGGAVAIIENPEPDGPRFIVEEIEHENSAHLCNAFLTYTDTEIPNVPCKRKILRQWTVLEWWCSYEIESEAAQLITIIDDEAPYFECPDDFTVSTDHDCGGNVYLEPVEVYDACAGIPEVMVQYANGTLRSNGGYVDLNYGFNHLTYIVSDGCYNQSTCDVNVTVKDLQAPVAICEQFKVVSVAGNSHVLVFAEPFDNGSWDDCALDRFEVRRMDSLCVASDTLFGESISFCCSDAGTDVMVVFRAYDKSNNFNDCMVQVEVQDKIGPSITCPPDQTIDCHDPYDLNNLSIVFGEALVNDNCAIDPIFRETVDDDVNQCGVGFLTRFIDLISRDSVKLAGCKQRITVENNSPFIGANIQWPLDYVAEDVCDITNIEPEDLEEPYNFPMFFGEDECTLLGYQYEDKVFQSANGCVHIKRSWTVINWCGSSNGNYDLWEIPEPQLIEIINTTAPEIEEQEDLLFESQDINCGGDTVRVVRQASDDCEFLGWYHIVTNENGDTLRFGLSETLEIFLPVGNYEIEWIVQDGCGNFDVDVQGVRMINTKAPTPVCINGLSVSLVGMDLDEDGIVDAEMAELWASDFDSGSSYSCGNAITLSLSRDTSHKNIIFDCDDIGRNEVQLWVTDVITGYQDFCISFVDVQDNNSDDICPDSLSMAIVQGDIFTEELKQVSNVSVGLSSSLPTIMSDYSGHYNFGSMPIGGQYNIIPEKNDFHLNGVSTLDLILIQRHILGIERIKSPYKLIAADVDGDGKISSTDLIELRKLILGIYDEFPDNKSWSFVDAEYEFLDEWNPWAENYPQTYSIDFLSGAMDVDFIGMKTGDVNGSVDFGGDSEDEFSGIDKGKTKFDFTTIQKDHGQMIVEVRSSNYNNVLGWQLQLSNHGSSMLKHIEAGKLDISSDDVQWYQDERGVIRISFHMTEPVDFDSDEILFYLHFENLESSPVFESVNSLAMKSEVYLGNGGITELEITNSAAVSDNSGIKSVSPNPWRDNALIHYNLTFREPVSFEFYNVSGQLIYKLDKQGEIGDQVLEIRKEDISASGLIYIRMITGKEIYDYKMLLLE